MNTIKILGGGISGLTAAIKLKGAGIDVEVYERKRFCGKRTGDFQFLENWTFESDTIDILKDLNILTNFYIKPWHSLEIISPSLKKCLKTSSRPLMYLVKRGREADSIDYALQTQAAEVGIPITFCSKLNIRKADIIATGIKKPTFIVNGISFPFDHPDKAIALLDDRLSFKIYSYFIVSDHRAQIVSINPVGRKDHKVRFDLTVKRFEEILNYKITTIGRRFAGPGSLYYSKSAKMNNQYFIGEAAGFQDCLLGFGLVYAFKSGYHAARSIIENDDFDRRWQVDMLKPMKVSRSNRLLYERLSNNGYEKVVHILGSRDPLILKLLGGDDFQLILRRLYNQDLSYFLRPILLWPKFTRIYQYLLNLIGRVFFKRNRT